MLLDPNRAPPRRIVDFPSALAAAGTRPSVLSASSRAALTSPLAAREKIARAVASAHVLPLATPTLAAISRGSNVEEEGGVFSADPLVYLQRADGLAGQPWLELERKNACRLPFLNGFQSQKSWPGLCDLSALRLLV